MKNLIKSLEKLDSEANMIELSIEKDYSKKSEILRNKIKEERKNILKNQNRKIEEIKKEIYTQLQKELLELENIYEEKKRRVYELHGSECKN